VEAGAKSVAGPGASKTSDSERRRAQKDVSLRKKRKLIVQFASNYFNADLIDL
jgi:hypothetical protein